MENKKEVKKFSPYYFLEKNSRGQGMSTTTIVLLVLGLIILVVLILGFTVGWQNFAPWLSTNNIDSIKTACSVACSTGGIFDFCTLNRTVRDGTNDAFEATCNELLIEPVYLQRNYGLEECGFIRCAEDVQ